MVNFKSSGFDKETGGKSGKFQFDCGGCILFRAALKHGIRNPESGNGITETETETETESIIIQEAVKNIPRYYTLNRRIRYIYYSTRGVQNCGPLLITRVRDIPT